MHFRRGFDDSGFAKTILVVEPEQPFLGTVRLDALPYKNVDVRKFYPCGDVSFPVGSVDDDVEAFVAASAGRSSG